MILKIQRYVLVVKVKTLKDFLLMYDSFCIQKYRLGKQSGKDMGDASRDGRFAITPSLSFQSSDVDPRVSL